MSFAGASGFFYDKNAFWMESSEIAEPKFWTFKTSGHTIFWAYVPGTQLEP